MTSQTRAHAAFSKCIITLTIATIGIASAAAVAGKKKGAAPTYYFGMQHAPNGAATLTPQPDGSLRVSNIGSSGKDGVSIDPGEVLGFRWEAADYSPSSSVACETIVCKMQRLELAIAGTTTEEFGFNFTKIPATNEVSLLPHLINITPECVRVEALLNGQLVVARDFDSVPAQLGIIDFGLSPETGHLHGSLHRPETALLTWGASFSRPSNPFQFRIENSDSPTLANTVHIKYLGPVSQSEDPGYESMHFSGTDSSGVGCELTVHAEAIIHSDVPTSGTGAGRIGGSMVLSDTFLTVSNIGSSGEDGVRFSHNPDEDAVGVLDGFQITCSNGPIIDGAPPVLLSCYTKFHADGVPTRAAMHHRDPGGGMNLEVEYEPGYRPTHVNLDIRNNDAPIVVIQDVPLSPGGTTVLGEIQDRANVRVEKFNFKQEFGPVQSTRYSSDVTFVPNGQAPIVCDEIVIIPLNAPEVSTEILSMDLTGQNLPPFTVGDITVVPSDPKPVYFGIEHEDIGVAQTSLDKNGHLIVSNIGSSGKDGVRMDLGEAEGWAGELDFGPAGSLGQGVSLTITARDQFDNPIPTFRIDEQGGGSAIGSFSWWDVDKPMTTRLYHNNLLVDEVTLSNSTFQSVVSGNIGSSGKDGVRFVFQNNESDTEFLFFLPADAQLTLNGSSTGPVTADTCRISVHFNPSEYTIVKSVQFMASNPAMPWQFSIGRQRILQFDIPNGAVGESTIEGFICGNDPPESKGLVVGNIGSSGCDGVSLSLRDSFGFLGDSELAGVVGSASVGGRSTVSEPLVHTYRWRQLQGPAGSTTPIGGGAMTANPGGGHDFSVDEVPWNGGPDTVSVFILNGNTLVTQVSGQLPGNPVAHVADNGPTYKLKSGFIHATAPTGQLAGTNASPNGVQHEFTWDGPVNLSVAGQPPVSGDRIVLRVVASGPAGGKAGAPPIVPTFDEIEILFDAGEVGDFVITSEGAEAIDTCPADLNHNGIVNVDDLLIQIGAWATASGDLNGNFVTNVDDLLLLIGAWGPCPP